MKRKLAINMQELTFAFDHSEDTKFYLDLETGTAVSVSEDTLFTLENLPADDDDDLETALQQQDEWQQDDLREAMQIQEGMGTRYLEIPSMDSHEGYEDMVDFIATLEDNHLAELLSVAIRGQGAFRRFKDVLYDYPEARERWFHFKDEQMQRRVLRWLDRQGIELGA
ncbi:MAG: hypothetical protein F9K27_17030 [Anaerolineae bacterium]|nr:MAG: hypothetical protein F9K27_17030 [Anaerolineae bacterium]